MNNYLTEIIISLIFYLTFNQNLIECETPVTGRCGRPAVPAKASKHLISPERSRFENKEKVIILCKKDEFPLFKHEVECRNGRWIGKQARCGQYVDAQVVHLDIFDCQSPSNELLVSQPLNQSTEPPPGYPPLKPNSFHTLRVEEGMKTSANGSKCYTFKIRFEKKIQIWFLLIEIWVQRNDTTISLSLDPFVSKYRTCVLQEQKRELIEGTIFRNYYICDLKNESDFKQEVSEMSDTITMNINVNIESEVGLDGVFVGDVFTISSSSRTVKPDCGMMQIQNIGVDAQEEVSHKYITCNDSFVDISATNIKSLSPNGNPIHKFSCNWNGVWEGNWPVCVPKMTCPQENILEDKDSSVIIEEVGNVYYLNESKWFAINESYIRYTCLHENDIMVGKTIRTCLKSGKWSSKPPYCTRTGISGLGIAGILFAVLIVFVIIVLIVFRMHSKRVKRELRETRNEIEETTRKRYSDQFYDDVKHGDLYDNSDPLRKSMPAYDSVDYETFSDPRYGADPHHNRPPSQEYLDMLALK